MNNEPLHRKPQSVHLAKLQIPDYANQTIIHSRCIDLLEREAHRPLLALAAPTGYGKTVLLGSQARLLAGRASVGWLTLDKEDNDPRRLLAYMARILPQFDNIPETRKLRHEAELGHDSPQAWSNPLPEAQLDIILQALNRMDEVHLFFDQYESIGEATVHRLFEYLITYSGKHVHFYIAGRTRLPFSSNIRRLHPEPLVISHEHLKVNAEEIKSWLNRKIRSLPATDWVARLEQISEGWPLALNQFASLWDGSRAIPSTEAEAVDVVHNGLRDMFADEFLRLPEQLQRFLLVTSIPDKFDAAIAGRLTEDAACHRHIEQALRENLFIFQEHNGQYRYHALYARFLRERFRLLDNDRFQAVQERMTAWYEQDGRTIEAARQALRIPDYERAAALLLRDVAAVFSCPREELIQLLDQFPAAQISSRPAIAMIYAWFLAAAHRITSAETVLEQAELHMPEGLCLFPPTGEDLRGYFASIRSRIHYMRRDAELGMAYMKETEARLNGPGYLYSHFNTIDAAGTSLLKNDAGHWGSIDQTIAMCEYAEAKWKGVNQGYGMIHVLLGECRYERNMLDKAETHLMLGRRIGLDLADTGLMLPASLTLVQLKFNRGEHQAAQTLLQETAQHAVREAGERGNSIIDACRARLNMTADQPAALRRWLRTRPIDTEDPLDMRRMYEYLTLLRAYIFLGHVRHGIVFGEKLLQFSQSWHLHYHMAEVGLLLAVLYNSKGDKSTAFRRLEYALKIGQTEGYIRLFLDEWHTAGPLLLKYGKTPQWKQPSASPDIQEFCQTLLKANCDMELAHAAPLELARKRLTPKEYKVLQCLIAGQSNDAIAKQLSISLETAKTHCKNIYRKLRLKSRKDVQRHFTDG